jgi:hypothetical protein
MGQSEITDYEAVRLLFNYDPETGKLTRKVTVSSRALRGMTVGCKNAAGYLVVRFQGKLHYVHRLAWLWMTGVWPAQVLDHENRNRQDNRWENLRSVTHSANHHNSAPNTRVYCAIRDKVWVASIVSEGKKSYIGSHKDRAVAEKMYADCKAQYLPKSK